MVYNDGLTDEAVFTARARFSSLVYIALGPRYTQTNVKLTAQLILMPWSGMNLSSMPLLAFIV
jgi:hypothetical protein